MLPKMLSRRLSVSQDLLDPLRQYIIATKHPRASGGDKQRARDSDMEEDDNSGNAHYFDMGSATDSQEPAGGER